MGHPGGFPPCRRKKVDRMGHGAWCWAKEMPAGFEGRRAVVFLVEISMAEGNGKSAILFGKFVMILKGVTNYFWERGLTSFPQPPAGTCGAADCGFAAVRAERGRRGNASLPGPQRRGTWGTQFCGWSPLPLFLSFPFSLGPLFPLSPFPSVPCSLFPFFPWSLDPLFPALWTFPGPLWWSVDTP
jgi:hypothetical protein